jgi:hypothetical protein
LIIIIIISPLLIFHYAIAIIDDAIIDIIIFITIIFIIFHYDYAFIDAIAAIIDY